LTLRRPLQITFVFIVTFGSGLGTSRALKNSDQSEEARAEEVLAHFQKAKRALEAGNFEQAAGEYKQVLGRVGPLRGEGPGLALTKHLEKQRGF
jgi:outer membrane protein assembly factor BamD (BamD/ComL family)